MGITLDSVKMEARLPEDKLHHTRDMLAAWSSRRGGSLRELQSLIGTLQFACRVISPGRPFMQCIINLTRGSQNQSKSSVSPKNSGKTSSCGKCFSITGMGLAFSSPHTPSPPPKFTSIPMLPDQLAMGFFFNNQWFQGKWLPSHQLRPTSGISIAWQELYPIYLATMLWAPTWANKRLCFHCDNQATVAILSAKSSKVPRIMNLIRLITFQTLRYNFNFTARHVPEVDNSIADSLSRFQMSRFRSLAPDASPDPCPIPLFLTHV